MTRNYCDRQNSERLEKLCKLFIEVSAAVPDKLNKLILAEVEKEMEQERIKADLEWLKGASKKELKMVGAPKDLSELSHKELGRIICLIELDRKRARASYLIRRFGNNANINFNNNKFTNINFTNINFTNINFNNDNNIEVEEEEDEENEANNEANNHNINHNTDNDLYTGFGFVTDEDRARYDEDMS
jgi:hypothetical protein